MKRSHPKKPTNSELEILKVLWKRGPSTVAQVREGLPNPETTGYTTVLKLLQIMHDKKLVDRDEAFRPHVYRARLQQAETQSSLLHEFIDRTFGGSASRMIVQALSSENLSEKELEEIRKIVKHAREGKL